MSTDLKWILGFAEKPCALENLPLIIGNSKGNTSKNK